MPVPSNLHPPSKWFPHRSDNSGGDPQPARPRVLVHVGLCAVTFVFLVVWLFASPTKRSRKSIPPRDAVSAVVFAGDDTLVRSEFFTNRVLADLQSTDESNHEAAARCIARIEQNFQSYRDHVDDFVGEVTGLKSRFGILRRMPGDWWTEDGRIGQYVTEKFERHLFSEAKLTQDLSAALQGFRDEVRANERGLLVRTRAAVAESDLPPLRFADDEAFFTAVSNQIRELANTEAQSSVADGIKVLLVSEVAGTAAGAIAARLVSSLAASAAVTAATTGGTTAGGAAAGAAGGSFLPGPGTAIGFVAGFVVGLVVDYWLSERSAAELRGELLRYITAIESDLLLGPADGHQPPAGFRTGIEIACEQLRDGIHQRLYEIIVLEQSP